MNWELRTIKVKDLIEWSGNPRKISREDLDNLKQSFVEFGHARTLTVAPEGKKFVIIGGNQSLKALKELGFKEIQCSVADREMTEQEKQKLSVFLNHRAKGEGEWDYDILNTWDADLADWGLQINWSAGVEQNQMNDNDVNLEEQFDPIGNSSGLQRVVFLFDGSEEAESYLNSLKVKFKKRNMAWQVNLSTRSIS